MKKWYKSKLIWYAILSGIAGVITAIQGEYPNLAILASINSVITVLLRAYTTQGIK